MLTRTQAEALDRFAVTGPLALMEETLYSGQGVSVTTASALVRLGLAEWRHEPHAQRHNNGPLSHGSRPQYLCDWSIRLTDHGQAVLARRKDRKDD